MPPIYQVQLLNNLPILLTVTVLALGVYTLGQPGDALMVILGVIAGGLVDLDHRLSGRLAHVGLTLLAFSFSALMVHWDLGLGYGFAAVMAALTFGFTMLGAGSSRYRTMALGTLVIATFTALAEQSKPGWGFGILLILTGTLVYCLSSLLVYTLFPRRPVQQQLSLAASTLGDFIRAKAQLFDPDQAARTDDLQRRLAHQSSAVVARLNESRRALSFQLTGRTGLPRTQSMSHLHHALHEIHARVSSDHLDYGQFGREWQYSALPFRIQRLLMQQAQCCADLAAELHASPVRDLPASAAELALMEKRLEGVWQREQGRLSDAERYTLGRAIENMRVTSEQLLNLLQPDPALDTVSGAAITPTEDESARAVLSSLRQNLTVTSADFRHAVRLSLAVTVSCLLALALHLPMGFWIMLTVLFVCQSSYTATRRRVNQRVAGTVAGVLVGSQLPSLVTAYEGRLFVVAAATALFFWFRSARYSWSTFFITVEVLMALALSGVDVQSAMLPRVLDTLVGAGLAWLAVQFFWPDWTWLDIRRSATQAVQSLAALRRAIAGELQQARRDSPAYHLARRQAYERAAGVSQEVSQLLTTKVTSLQLHSVSIPPKEASTSTCVTSGYEQSSYH